MKTMAFFFKLSLLTFVVFICFGTVSRAEKQASHKSYLLAQVDPDEAYDPFSDYSEFDEESDEEADINFFRNGRFFTLSFLGGSRGYTGNFANTYQPAPTFGLAISYFFDLRLALAIGYQMGDSAVAFTTNGGANKYRGNVSISELSFNLKYYLNTQNITRGLADINPYILGGMGQVYRTQTIANIDASAHDSTMGFNFGAGVEIPLMRKKAYLGLQATYHYVEFGDENKTILSGGAEVLDKNISGDLYDLVAIIGMNF